MPGLSSDDHFRTTLAIADNLLKANKTQVRFGPTGKMRFIIDEGGLKAAVAGSGVDDAKFREIFHGEVAPLVEAVIRDNVDEYVQHAQPFFVADDSPEAQKALAAHQATLRARAALVGNTSLVSPELRARYVIRVSSKHPRLRSSAWEVARKLYLSDKAPWLQPYVTLSLETLEPETRLGVWSWFPFFPIETVGRSDRCTFDCDEADLDDLIKALQEAKTALERTRKGTSNG